MLKINKQTQVRKLIIFIIAFLIIFIPALAMNIWARNQALGAIGDQNLWLHIYIVFNTGAAFGMGQDKAILIRILQFIVSSGVLCVLIFWIKNKTYSFFLSAIAIGGYFNFFDGIIHSNGVADYFQFTNDFLVKGAIFNVPDMCVVGGTILFLCFYLVNTIIKAVRGSEIEINKKIPVSLFIDCAQKTCYLCLFQGQAIIKKKEIKTNNNLTDLIIEHIKTMLKYCEVDKKDIKNIYVTTGPGSFTGTRVGTLIAKTWGNIEAINIYTISSLQLQISKDGISILDAKSSKYYVGIYKHDKLEGKIKMMSLDEITKLSKEKKLEIYKDYENINISHHVLLHLNDFKKISNINELEPLYIKDPV